ncbi:MAG: hypothetical protein A2X18_02650 [Bacteroidetes bacterium GWF2_40_14]|nr:MAG: hypothetical protein A2X18_02650 [Bacteroidetes bacterium GWF2_40_14]
MDLITLSKLLRELLLTHDRVSLPGMGSFIAELAPSVFSDRALVIHPPFRRVLFRTSEVWNDELLENSYAIEINTDFRTAKEKIQAFMKEFVNELNIKKSIKIPDFGTMRATDQRDYFFVADKDLFIYPEAYGLEPINVKLLNKPGRIELLSYKETNKLYQPQPDKESKIKMPRIKAKKIKEPLSKSAKRTILTFSVLSAIVAIIVLMVVFKDQLQPFWEWLLYSSDDRELLKQL